MQVIRSFSENVERRFQLETVPEQPDACKDVQAQPRPGHGDDQTPHVTQMAHVLRLDQTEQNVVILLSLKLVYGGDFMRPAN